ncbi:MAG TPA: hypothetical protein VJ672_16435 [Gemmatimonadaceae bacterium]|nr:hypothetical protein [Gemmatimonadaceae bacterium]
MLRFPLDLRFKIIAIAPQITVTDAGGAVIAYVKQKAFKLKEAVTVFSDATQSRALYRIEADRVLDISATYHIADASGTPLGAVQRRGMKSIWRAHYEIHRDGRAAFLVREENPWIKLIDGFIGEIPIVGLFTGYLLHPAYRVTRANGDVPVLRAVKKPALFEGRYVVDRIGDLSEDEERLTLLGVIMLLLLERERG